MKDLSNLKEIDLTDNSLEIFPYQLSSINSLQKINLSNNNIDEINSDIQYFTNLLELNMSGNFKSYERFISDKIEMLTNLQSLDLSNCSLYSSEIPKTLFNLYHLRYLNLSDNKLRYIPKNIENLTNLVTLNLAKNRIFGNR